MEFKRQAQLHGKVDPSMFAAYKKSEWRNAVMHIVDVAERAERYEDMASYVRLLLEDGSGFHSQLERDKLIIAYKNVLTALRQSLHEVRHTSSYVDINEQFAQPIIADLRSWSMDFLHLIETCLLPAQSNSPQDIALLYKTIGDCYRYLAECDSYNRDFVRASEENYLHAEEIASKSLRVTDPVRLGIALNFSVFQHEVLGDSRRAIDTADAAFDASMGSVDNLDKASFPDSALVMQFLKDNLGYWERLMKMQ